jgi:hypothetical protein
MIYHKFPLTFAKEGPRDLYRLGEAGKLGDGSVGRFGRADAVRPTAPP